MFRNIVPSLSRKYTAPEVVEPNNNKPSEVVKTSLQPKRRALGDITNNTITTEDIGDATKKPILSTKSTTESDSESKEEVDSDRPYMQRASDDIDARDAGNPLLATSYVNEMYDFFNSLERDMKVSPSYMTNQSFINERMRAILIDWLVSLNLIFSNI